MRSKSQILSKLRADGHITDEEYKTLEQDSCEDAISREELLKAIDTWDKFGCNADTKLVPYQDHYIPYIHYDDVIKCIKGIPSVTPQQKIGHWIVHEIEGTLRWLECSNCHCETSYNVMHNYCPNCGAKMVEPQERSEE